MKKVIIATAAAIAFANVPLTSFAAERVELNNQIACYGINSCQGLSDCRTATNICRNHNSCKGRGFLYSSTEVECTSAGGKVSDFFVSKKGDS